ncbi:auxilin-like protein 1 [Diospyros lotus]|uniref:auxilin-like protein 1 n=1 Tax=Diospyros lotus TaxID=55363 RepID=UPI002252CDA9|nr:auxilin-like protein 1 [Diospyros lotus]
MENLSHSLSKKTYNGNGFGAAKTAYDDVFGGPPKFGVPTLSPRLEDYAEIFGGFHASRGSSSIPVLDLPPVDAAVFSFDVRSSHFDYSEVFGSFDGLDFAVPFEELLYQSKATYDSSDEAWTPAQSESLSDESDPSACSERNGSLSNEESYQSCNGTKQFNVSYNKSSERSKEDMSNRVAHVTQLHAVPGFTYIVNETPSETMKDKNTQSQVTSDRNPTVNFSGELAEGKRLRKTMSHPSNSSFGMQTQGPEIQSMGSGKPASYKNEAFVTISDINLRTQPSQLPPPARPPPALGVKDGVPYREKSKLKASKSFAFGETAGDSSPPFFDVEVDASSSAAVSAAAVKDAMEKAQVKLRSAKELMERKKESLQNHTDVCLSNNAKEKEGKAGKALEVSNSFEDEKVHGTCERDHSGLRTFTSEERQKTMKKPEVISDSSKREEHINEVKTSENKKLGKEHISSQEFNKTNATVAWVEAAEFYEVVETNGPRKIFEQAKDRTFLVQNTNFHDRRSPRGNEERKVTAASRQQGKEDGEIKSDMEACEHDENKRRPKGNEESSRLGEHQENVKVKQEVCKLEKNGKKTRMAQQHENFEDLVAEAYKCEESDNLAEVQQKDNVMEVELEEAKEQIDGKRHKDARDREENESRLKETLERERYEKSRKAAIEQAETEKRLKKALDQEEKEKQQREAYERKEEKRLKEIHEREENERRLKEACEREENEKRLKEACEREENEKRLKEAQEREENEKRLKEVRAREENEKRLKEPLGQEENKKELKMDIENDDWEVHGKMLEITLKQEENDKRLKLAHERDENQNRIAEDRKWEEIEKNLSSTLQQGENVNEQKEGHEREENEETLNGACKRQVNESRLKETWEQEQNKKPLQEAYEREESGKRSKEAIRQKEIEKRSEEFNKSKEAQKKIEDVGYSEELKKERKDNEKNERDENERKLKSDRGAFVHKTFKAPDNDCMLNDLENLQPGLVTSRHDKVSMKVKKTEGEAFLFEEDNTLRTEPTHSEAKLEAVEIGEPQVDRDRRTPTISSNPGRPNVLTNELGERGTNVKEDQVIFDKEEGKDKFMPSQVVRELNERERNTGTDQPTVFDGKRNAQSTVQKVSTRQNTERKEKNMTEILAPEERERERIKRERELEMDRLRKLEEEREREREREKDRMAVDRATLEARDRAFAEARERAERVAVERATAEVRQRAMTEARERLEKASAEARERSLAEKASTEARLRAERAAVERATAEARERAFQKAMAEKATFEARERVERPIADKSSGSYKNGGMRQTSSVSDMQTQGVGSAGVSIYSYSAVHGGVEGESPQRCKARLERHRRTAERAARALAEKNMRDLLAQREQAERNRLAEMLDAEVRRWSSGKEGNLRALLSTLQYILGHDSGWQPIPLTEVITSAAVKKAYRKATLCVHPDKLQQRGASIQQKYICEKVFDLLKEAWNKFNSEER